jgi:hypothetical protein
MKNLFILLFVAVISYSCNSDKEESPNLFQLKDSATTGITFNNALEYTESLNPYTYRNFFNGGGVALGDINNDGLLDIYFTGNLVDNQLYLNKGNWQFEDITSKAGVSSEGVWSSGVSFIDINNDGLLDIYVCKAGPPSDNSNRHNELFINNGDLTFTEKSIYEGIRNLKDYVENFINYIITSTSEQFGAQRSLLYMIVLIISLFLLKNLFNYLGLYFITFNPLSVSSNVERNIPCSL